MKTMSMQELLDSVEKAHKGALKALDAYHRAGTATARKHYERYEKLSANFDTQLTQLRAALPAACAK